MNVFLESAVLFITVHKGGKETDIRVDDDQAVGLDDQLVLLLTGRVCLVLSWPSQSETKDSKWQRCVNKTTDLEEGDGVLSIGTGSASPDS